MTTITYSLLTAEEADKGRDELYNVLSACVALGASIGFVSNEPAPMRQFWTGVIASLASGEKRLLVARRQQEIVGTVIVEFCGKPNGAHRAEIAKLLVHPDARRQGIARELLCRAERLAVQQGKTLLVLDTRAGDAAEQLYLAQDWQVCGQIPQFATSTRGEPEATTVMYKLVTAGV
ncbi:GNAT family N-acetyltransferase [Erwinia sp. 198]|uniref:GNAT family N-acetyltransferase n=1 Tax=Erwinia sp. 198 TaxID=2022746 RepID=UPI000F659916|nr:GNAT family N-acetyltransferase [Erwinia sp. 198]RRZ92928.1 GNAT family N-acetyltransferase [Erwinia sp. 198]